MIIFRIVAIVVGLGLAASMFRQVRNPRGLLGRRVLRAMNIAHSALTDWGLQQVTIAPNATILDVGCGGGRTLQKLVALAPSGKAVGVDYSATSAAVAREMNATEVQDGRAAVARASVAALPFPDLTFDVVTAVETHYYWPDLPANLRQVFKILKPGGTFVLIAETYRGGPLRLVYEVVMPLLRATLLSDAEHRDLLTQAGFADVATKHKRGTNWICAVGRRPM